MQAKFSNAFDSLTRQVKSLRQTPLEKDVTDATSNDNWGVANSALIELARATNDYTNYAVVMKGVWEGIGDKKDRWRRIFKSLVLLEYCIKNGSDRCGDEARSELHKLRALEDFKFMEEGRDKGAGIRDKSKQLVELLGDAELLKAEKAKARESKEKYVGIASNAAGGQTIVAPSGYVGSSAAAPVNVVQAEDSEVNGTSKLDEYREKDRIRRQEENKTNVVLSNSGRVIVKPPPIKAAKPLVVSSSSSSSSDEDDLIDFGSTVPTAPPMQTSAQPVSAQPVSAQPVSAQPVSAYAQAMPQYGQSATAYALPQYGQPVSAYAQPMPQYGQPVSGQPISAYAQAMPQYGQSVPQYGQPGSAYGQSVPQYGQPVSAYAQSVPQYGQPVPQYGQPISAYAQYRQPAPQFGQPNPTAPTAQYGQPVASAVNGGQNSNPFAAFNGL